MNTAFWIPRGARARERTPIAGDTLSHLLGCQKKGEKCLWGALRSRDIVNSQSLVGMPEEGREMFTGCTEIQRYSRILSHLLGFQKKSEKCLWGALRSRDIDNSQSLVGMPEEG
jgi:hypothetical protein